MQSSDHDLSIKLLIIGDSGVGKTCLLMRYCESVFNSNHLTTIGIDFKLKTIDVNGKKVKLQIWDTAGQERFRNITTSYYKGAQGIILVYGIDDRISFQNISNWMKQIETSAKENVCKIIVGNKSDVGERVISTVDGQSLANSYGVPFFETSARAGKNVFEMFDCIAKQVIEQSTKTVSITPSEHVSIQPSNNKQQKKTDGCC